MTKSEWFNKLFAVYVQLVSLVGDEVKWFDPEIDENLPWNAWAKTLLMKGRVDHNYTTLILDFAASKIHSQNTFPERIDPDWNRKLELARLIDEWHYVESKKFLVLAGGLENDKECTIWDWGETPVDLVAILQILQDQLAEHLKIQKECSPRRKKRTDSFDTFGDLR